MKKGILFLLLITLCFTSTYAQTIRASTGSKDVYVMQPFDVTYTIEGSVQVNFTPPDFSPFRVTAGPFSSSNVQIINGVKSESKSFTYRLTADKPGKYKIPAAKIASSTLKRNSNSLVMNVLKASNKTAMQGNDLFLEMSFSDSLVYVGQQLLIDHDLYFGDVDVKGSALVGDFPRDRFLVNQVLNGTRISKTPAKYNNKDVFRSRISRLALYPLRSGKMDIPDINFDVDIQNPNSRRRRGFFSFNSYDSKVVRTPEFVLDVLPLPDGAPESYTGCVGSLTSTATIERRNLVVGEEVFVSLTMKGDGIADQVDAPKWKQDGFQIYDPKLAAEDKKIRNGQIIFTKTFQYLVIPDVKDELTLRIPVSHFDNKTGEYVTKNVSVGRIQIKPSGQTLTDATNKTIKTIDQKNSKAWYKKLWIWAILTVFFAVVTFYFSTRKKSPEEKMTLEEASRIIAQRKLASAKDLLDRKETGKYWETLENALRIYLEEKLELDTSQYSEARIADRWTEKKYESSKLDVWKEMVNKINLARYAGQDISNMENLYKEALDWIVDVEKTYVS